MSRALPRPLSTTVSPSTTRTTRARPESRGSSSPPRATRTATTASSKANGAIRRIAGTVRRPRASRIRRCTFVTEAALKDDAVQQMASTGRKRPRLKDLPGGQFTELVVIVATALVIALAVQWLLLKPYRIPSGSMEPTLDVG